MKYGADSFTKCKAFQKGGFPKAASAENGFRENTLGCHPNQAFYEAGAGVLARKAGIKMDAKSFQPAKANRHRRSPSYRKFAGFLDPGYRLDWGRGNQLFDRIKILGRDAPKKSPPDKKAPDSVKELAAVRIKFCWEPKKTDPKLEFGVCSFKNSSFTNSNCSAVEYLTTKHTKKTMYKEGISANCRF